MHPTNEQLHILSILPSTGNLLINALAGTGKSTTLKLIDHALPQGEPILYLAFNKSVVKEVEEDRKDPDAFTFQDRTLVRTFNSCGHRIWMKTVSKVKLDPKKCQEILREHIKTLKKDAASDAWSVYWDVISAVGLAKSLGYVPNGKYTNARRLASRSDLLARLEEEPSEYTFSLIDHTLTESIRTAYKGWIDFNDQVYMPALFGGSFPRFPLVMVDEAQDLSPTNHAMLDKLVTDRIIAVGDPWQSIYGFRGAEQEGMGKLKERFGMQECDLSISFRCPQRVVEAARWRVPHFKWIRKGGHVQRLTQMHVDSIPDTNVAIISRNNAPLFRMAFNLLSMGRSVSVAGSDIGPKLIGILRKFGSEDLPRSAVLVAIQDWRQDRVDKGSTTAPDLAAAMEVFAHHGDDLGQAIAYADHLFKQEGSIKLMTGHKAKGLEFPTVYHLDPWSIKDDEQDLNLRYVITTRASERLYEIDSVGIRW